MTHHDLINTLRQGRPITNRLVTAIIIQLERLDGIERTLQQKDRDFSQLSIAYSAAMMKFQTETKGVRLTNDECGYICDTLEECELAKEKCRVLEALVCAVKCADCGGISLDDIDGKSWFNVRKDVFKFGGAADVS